MLREFQKHETWTNHNVHKQRRAKNNIDMCVNTACIDVLHQSLHLYYIPFKATVPFR